VPSVRFLLVVAGILALAGSGSSGSGGVQTLYTSKTGPIAAFAQDGSLIAWFAPEKGSCNQVHLLSLAGVEVSLPKAGTNNVTCRWDVGGGQLRLAVASGAGAALWTLHQRASIELDYVVGADVRQPEERRFYQLAHTHAGAGLWLGGIAGSGTTLVYSVTRVSYVNQVACLSGGSCARLVRGGGVHRIEGRRNPLIPGTGPALAVATAAGRIAYIRAGAVAPNGTPEAQAGAPVEVRTASDGVLVTHVTPQGTPVALALTPHVLVLLEHVGKSAQVAWFDALHGTRLGSVRVPAATSYHLTANDQLVVYRVGHVLHEVAFASGTASKLVKATTTPLGFALAGSRLAWAINVHGEGRIQALFVGGRG
jgi:hypothetical protein